MSAQKLFEPAALFITFREAVEAGVIISVALAFLRKTDMMHLKPQGAPV
jgi:high-affinity Fe2+/Pb2+ permease